MRLARLLVCGVVTAPAAVLAQLDPVGRISPRLIRLIVAPLALLTCEGDSDSYVSAGHSSLWFAGQLAPPSEKRPLVQPVRRDPRWLPNIARRASFADLRDPASWR